MAAREDGTARVGVTDYAQDQLGDVVFVDLPETGRLVSLGDVFGEVESTKSVSELFAPVAGEVTAANAEVVNAPELVNSDPYGEGWLVEIKLEDPSSVESLLSAEDYQRLTEG